MIRRRLLLAAAVPAAASALSATPAAADIVVIGAGNARMCYLAAESKMAPRSGDLQRCNAALWEDQHKRGTLVATHVNRGILRMRAGDMPGAIADFDAATALNPDEPEAYLNRAAALLRQRDVAGAIAQFDEAIARNTQRPALAHYGRAIANEEAGHVRAAYQDYLKATQLAPAWEEPQRELARFKVVSK